MDHRITVVIPAYGPGPHLEEVLTSLQRQLDDGVRVIVSHSGEDDPSERLAEFLRVEVIHSDERLFAGAARNRALAHADTEWVAFVDEDVVPGSDWFAALNRAIKADDADCILGAIDYRTSGGYWGMSLWFGEFGPCHPYLPRRPIKGGASANMAVRREPFLAIGGFPENWRFGQDTVAHARMAEANFRLLFDPSLVVHHHNRGGIRHALRHMHDHGRFSARVRRDYPTLPGGAAVTWPILSLGMFPARLMQASKRVLAAKNSPKLTFLLHFPGIAAGYAAWSMGFAREAFHPTLKPNDH